MRHRCTEGLRSGVRAVARVPRVPEALVDLPGRPSRPGERAAPRRRQELLGERKAVVLDVVGKPLGPDPAPVGEVSISHLAVRHAALEPAPGEPAPCLVDTAHAQISDQDGVRDDRTEGLDEPSWICEPLRRVAPIQQFAVHNLMDREQIMPVANRDQRLLLSVHGNLRHYQIVSPAASSETSFDDDRTPHTTAAPACARTIGPSVLAAAPAHLGDETRGLAAEPVRVCQAVDALCGPPALWAASSLFSLEEFLSDFHDALSHLSICASKDDAFEFELKRSDNLRLRPHDEREN